MDHNLTNVLEGQKVVGQLVSFAAMSSQVPDALKS